MSADESGGTGSLSVTNGEPHSSTPDPSSLATPGKRKRVSSHDDKPVQDTSNSSSKSSQEKFKLQETLRNLVEILSKNDGDLQLLSCPLSSSPTKPRSKRAKVAGDKDEGSSIEARVAADRYNTLSEFLSDIERASTAVIERNKSQASAAPADGTPLTETVNRIAAFKKLLNSLVRQAQSSPSNIKTETSEDGSEAPAKSTPPHEEARSDSLVLTLFGNPANPKHLFSSLQKSVKVPLPSDDPQTEKCVEVQAPLREDGLPNGITTTRVAPHNLEAKSEVPKRTFGEVFAPRPTLPQLEPPRRARSTSRGAFNTWIDPFEAITNFKSFLGDRNNYCLTPLPSGQWLQYGGVTSSPSYWNRRQKQQPSHQHGDEKPHEDSVMWVDDDTSVWQGVYSSFAPSFDSSGAVVQVDSKDLVWWNKQGAKRLHMLLSIPYQEENDEAVSERPGNIGELDESTLEEMVKTFNPEDFVDSVFNSYATKDKEDKTDGKDEEEEDEQGPRNMDELLRDISDLLETLNSYQRIRNLELSSSSSQDADPKETVPDLGTADAPSAAEQGVYDTLRSSLAAMVSNLPPHAVAKLNGDQLDELNISQKIVIENPDYHGTMEKDDFTLQQERSAAMAPVAGGVNRTSTPSRPPNFPPGYNQRAYSHNARAQQSQGGFQTPQPYYGARQSSTSGPYTPGPQQHYSAARPPSTPSQRPGYPPGYAQPTPQYNQGNAAAQFQRPGSNGYHPYATQPGMPTAQASPQQQFHARPGQPGAYSAPYGVGRSASPQKPPSYTAPRTPYMTPSANPQRYMPQQQPPPYGNYPSNQAPPSSGSYSNSAAAMTYARSAAEQAALMERHKAQLSSTPQPPAEQGGTQDRSVTPGNKQNGTPVAS
ncbi:hypothetical protein EYZ11_000592 [Aspergillus tanneri]|uniref:Uncharacterized protein n=1 Tax=Aspergillus tanneri TaxID=1220188 RepID=A0A4S3JWM6_9EURO|nr:uncharacterized protein ATNIH1004_007683 [Aspergillus tanneri]KAA8646256.1 hypothetical protein ATNIH1004_007683 [Aspergillus tanneri]THC99894.1 hypothetical protein EYZ11_000592 [Aspergillus tanneri]